jgi:hypothetical protein
MKARFRPYAPAVAMIRSPPRSIRRGVNMTYIVENNGVYGLTKGQFSATADRGSNNKRGVTNSNNAIDLVAIALQLGISCGAEFLRRQGPASATDPGGRDAPGLGLDRRRQPLHRLQSSRRLDPEF